MSSIRRQVAENLSACLIGINVHVVHELTVVMACAVQSPMGDISYLLKFFRQYVGLQASATAILVQLNDKPC